MISKIDPQQWFAGCLLIAVPHMDDGVLGCGGTIWQLQGKSNIYIIYATDGSRSPEPLFPGRDQVPPYLSQLRQEEAQEAMGSLGVPQENIHFLDLPDGNLRQHKENLVKVFQEFIDQIRPDHILVPFRYDRHPDHLALNHVLTDLVNKGNNASQLHEYFVYHRWKLLPKGDIREYISSQALSAVDISLVNRQKRRALECFKTQTTRFFKWQTRPNLTPKLLDEVCSEPEYFLHYEMTKPNHKVFSGSMTWIRLSHRIEPIVKKKKDQMVALTHRWKKNKDGEK